MGAPSRILPVADPGLREALSQLQRLGANLRRIVAKDQEQEVRGIALPVLDAVIGSARAWVPLGHPVASRIQDAISPESVAGGEPIRAVDALLVVDALAAVLAEQLPKPQPQAPEWVRKRYQR
jgi:hypothetical protein